VEDHTMKLRLTIPLSILLHRDLGVSLTMSKNTHLYIIKCSFMPLILPCEDSYLRAVATQRPARRVESHEYLHSSVE